MDFELKIVNLLYKYAKKAAKRNEVPVSAVIVDENNRILAIAYNKKEKFKDITAHAEVIVIKKAAKKLKSWNLSDCTLYVSLKPCHMCCEIIKQSRIKKVVYFLDKLESKKEFQKTCFEKIENRNFTSSYQQLFSDFFENKR